MLFKFCIKMFSIDPIENFNDCKEGNISMKSSFVLISLFSALFINVALAQSVLKPSAREMKPQDKKTFDKFYDRLRISWFGVLTTPHFDDMEKGNWRNAATSPEFGNAPKGDKKNEDTWPTNMWNQISFNYNFGAKMNFVVNPRFAIPLTPEKDMSPAEDKSLILLDDLLFGFQGVVYSTEDKKLNLWIRPGIRLPTSRGSRTSGQGGAGTLSNQLELAYLATYDFTKTWQMGVFGQARQWVIDDRYNRDRFRFYTAPFVQYTINDTSRIQVYYETMLETDRRAKPTGDRDPIFKDLWQNIFAGYSKDVNAKLNVMPFIGCFVNDTPVTDKSVWLGAWMSYQFK